MAPAPSKFVFRERDHNPCVIDYDDVSILDFQEGEEWYEGRFWIKIEIKNDLNPLSPDNHLGKIRWVLDYAVVPGNEYSFEYENSLKYWKNYMTAQSNGAVVQ